ncbi:MAG: hypothetical protein M0D57_20940 [Sphingobacteriales bacterium JAD_PAG50586_3]|nr:MAG: hypothetical protein M0D57_20940 [Sphingobacteriales bacterium JAD_PAG50586_3]
MSIKVTAQKRTLTISNNDSIIFYSNGQKKNHLDICNNGIKTVIDSTGNILSQEQRKGCDKNGINRSFYDNLMPEEIGYYKNNKKDGHWYYWRIDGMLKKEEWYENGSLKKEINY